MFWNEEETAENFQIPDTVIDVSFKISCKEIPLDHAWSLADAIFEQLPWFTEEPQAAIHHIYIPQSGNGWQRDDSFENELIQLSRRTRLKIRIPKNRLNDLMLLENKIISVDGNALCFGKSDQQLLSTITTIAARHVHIPDTDDDEQLFLAKAHKQIQAIGIKVRKMMCGKAHFLKTVDGKIKTRSLMITDISPEESILLQQKGVGSFYHYGCGIFIPQKAITATNANE